jgi:DNA helicase-4
MGTVSPPCRYLLAVGGDCQSINRFAGADLAVMTEFTAWFGRGPPLALTTTFRCPQSICATARVFASKNPRQFSKTMRSVDPAPGVPVDIVRSNCGGRSHLPEAAIGRARRWDDSPREDGTVSINVLGRSRHEAGVVPRLPPHNLNVTFRTVHGSKVLEADYILIPAMTNGTYGFPSAITDDPVLHLAMPAPDTYEQPRNEVSSTWPSLGPGGRSP